MSLRTAIESLPGRVVRGVFGTSNAMDINKTVGAVLAAGLLAMVTGLIADVLVSSEEGGHGGEARVAKSTEGGEAPAGGGGAAPAAATVEPILSLLASADVSAGHAAAKKCASCHTFEKGGSAKVGPNLYGILGAKRAHMEGFAYSKAIRNLGGEWTYQELNKFIAGPRAYVPGTKMSFGGIKNAKERAEVIAYLRTNADTSAPLPTDEEIQAAMAEKPGAAQTAGGQQQSAPATGASATQAQNAAPAGAAQVAQTVNGATAPQIPEQTAQADQPAGGGGDLAALIGAADPDQGKQIARKCLSCHSFEPGGPNKVGPNLAGVVGADIASKNYAYSDALKSKEGTWTYENLNTFLSGPRGWVPGTKMTFPGLKKPEERAAVIAYLRTLTDNPPPLQ